MTSSPLRLPRFTPIQMTGMVLMVGAVLAGAGLFAFSRSARTPERTVIVNVSQFPHIGSGPQVVAVFEDVNCPHCREFQSWHMGRLMTSARAGQITLVDVQFPSLKDSFTLGAKMLRCTWKHVPNRYYPLRDTLYRTMEGVEPQLGDYLYVLGKNYKAVRACADGAQGTALLEADQNLSARVGVHSTPFVSLVGGVDLRSSNKAQHVHVSPNVMDYAWHKFKC